MSTWFFPVISQLVGPNISVVEVVKSWATTISCRFRIDLHDIQQINQINLQFDEDEYDSQCHNTYSKNNQLPKFLKF
ncbi:hypothetical protein ACH3XW_40185 [Acanthocheilonema viteae]